MQDSRMECGAAAEEPAGPKGETHWPSQSLPQLADCKGGRAEAADRMNDLPQLADCKGGRSQVWCQVQLDCVVEGPPGPRLRIAQRSMANVEPAGGTTTTDWLEMPG